MAVTNVAHAAHAVNAPNVVNVRPPSGLQPRESHINCCGSSESSEVMPPQLLQALAFHLLAHCSDYGVLLICYSFPVHEAKASCPLQGQQWQRGLRWISLLVVSLA